MRINATARFGLILLILGVIMLLNVWATPMSSVKARIGRVESGETFGYGLFLAPVGLGTIGLDGETITMGPGDDGPVSVKVVAPVRLVVVSPSGETLVDMEDVMPYSVDVDFTERGEYVVYVTNLSDETIPIPVSVDFPRDTGIVYREADKFLVSIILTASGIALFCIGLIATLITKHKKTNKTPNITPTHSK